MLTDVIADLYKDMDIIESEIDSIRSYKNYSRQRILKLRTAIDTIAQSSAPSGDGMILLTKDVTANCIADILDLFILKAIADLVKYEKSKKVHVSGFDNEIKCVLDLSNPNHLNHQVALQIAAKLRIAKNYEIIGYDDLHVRTPSGLEFFMECKQPSKKENIFSSIDTAITQLEKKRKGDYGVVIISLDSILGPRKALNLTQEYQNIEEHIKKKISTNATAYIIGVIITSNHFTEIKGSDGINFNIISAIASAPFLINNRSNSAPDMLCFQQMIKAISAN